MTEKARLTSPQSDNLQSPHFQPEDEISLLDLLEVLVRKKALLFATVSIVTLLSILYAYSITPIYRATIGFQPSESNLASLFPGFISEILPDDSIKKDSSLVRTKNYLFNKFLLEFQSYSIQEKVFNEEGFLKRFVDDNPDANMGKRFVQEFNRSIHAGNTTKDKKGTSIKGFHNQTVSFELDGTKPEVISDFLNALAERTKREVVIGAKEAIQQRIKVVMDQSSVELEKYHSKLKAEKADKIRLYSDNLEIAKNLGVLDNNFSGSAGNTSLMFGEFPIWFLYGQRALEEELKVLERRGVFSQYTEEIAELDYKMAYLSKIDLSKINFEPVIINQFSIPPTHPIKPDRIKIIIIGVLLGLFIGILMVFFSCCVEQLNKKSKLSSSH